MAKQTKMNEDMRRLARDALLTHATKGRLIASFQRERAIFDRIYALAIPPKEMKALKALDKKWLATGDKIKINALGWQLTVKRYLHDESHLPQVFYNRHHGNQVMTKSPPTESVIMPRTVYHNHYDWDLTTDLPLPDDLATEAQQWAQEKKGLRETVTEIGSQILSTVAGFATLEAIPEIATLEPRILEPKKREQALVPNVQGLMCKIAGLRGEEREGCAELAQAA